MSHSEDMISAADHRAAVSAAVETANREHAAALVSATAAAKADGVSQERARVAAILDAEEAKGREAQAALAGEPDASIVDTDQGRSRQMHEVVARLCAAMSGRLSWSQVL